MLPSLKTFKWQIISQGRNGQKPQPAALRAGSVQGAWEQQHPAPSVSGSWRPARSFCGPVLVVVLVVFSSPLLCPFSESDFYRILKAVVVLKIHFPPSNISITGEVIKKANSCILRNSGEGPAVCRHVQE